MVVHTGPPYTGKGERYGAGGGGLWQQKYDGELTDKRDALDQSTGKTTEYRQSGNDHFLATFPHDRKVSPGWWGGRHANPPFTITTITYKVAVYAPAERANTPPISSLPQYVLCVEESPVKEQKRSGTNIDRFFSWPQEESSSAVLHQDQEKMSPVEAVD
jgi:hypothetical protein